MRRVMICFSFVVTAAAQQSALRDYGRLPLVFEPNQGQTDPSVKFLARTGGGTLFLTEREMVFAKKNAKPVRMRLTGSRQPEAIHGLEPTGGISNYFIGKDPSKWRTNIPNYGRVEYKSVYAGVDLVYYGNPRKLEYDLIVAPGADARAIQVEYEGVESLRVDCDGDLVLKTADGELRQKRPVAYQETAGGRVEVEVGYRLKGRRVAFELARYDAGRRLVIDPVFFYSTYLGGSGNDHANGIALDGSGATYLTGETASIDFPTSSPLQAANSGVVDAFVTKINATGSARVYSTYLGGNGFDIGNGITVDGAGNAYVTGLTSSTNFPTTNPPQASIGGSNDSFVAKMNNAGSTLLYATYLGGSASDYGNGIAVDGSGNAYVTGYTFSTDFPTTNPLQGSSVGWPHAFVTKINAAGSAKLYSTYLGGLGDDQGRGIAVDGSGNAYVTGNTSSSASFPTTNPIQAIYGGGPNDAFVAKINAAGSALVYSTYLGGSGNDVGRGIAVDSAGNASVTGQTSSTSFPTINPIQAIYGGNSDVFVTKINAAGSANLYSTYLGGSGDDVGRGIAVDSAGNAFVAGYTNSTNFPTTNPLQASPGGNIDAFVTKINTPGSARLYSTYLGGSGSEEGRSIAVDGAGNAYVAGDTTSTNFPTTNPLQASNAGGYDAFVTSLSGNAPVGVFRDSSGAVRLTSELSTLLSNAGGAFASNPAVAQNAWGDTYVVARDNSNAIWVNVYDSRTQTWDGWSFAGGDMQGTPAVVVVNNFAAIAARDNFNAYWINLFTRRAGFDGWANWGGAFTTDPVLGFNPGLAQLYIAGKDNFNAIWTGRAAWYVFSGWQLVGAVAQGKPAMTVGRDNAAYIVIRDPSNAIWMGRQLEGTFDSWQPGGGTIASDPQVAAGGGTIYAAARTSNGGVWYNTFVEGTGNNWVSWQSANGTLVDVAAAAGSGPQLFLTGRDSSNQLWWYETPGAGWKFVGHAGVAAGPLSAAPR